MRPGENQGPRSQLLDVLGCISFMAMSGSALVCRLRRAFSSDDSENPRLWLVEPDLSELPDFTLNPRLLLGEVGDWGVSILLGVPPYFFSVRDSRQV